MGEAEPDKRELYLFLIEINKEEHDVEIRKILLRRTQDVELHWRLETITLPTCNCGERCCGSMDYLRCEGTDKQRNRETGCYC